MMDTQARLHTEKLRWHSRRALLENDLILERFWASQPDILPDALIRPLESLLALEDHDLWELLSGRRNAAEPTVQDLVVLLRQPAVLGKC